MAQTRRTTRTHAELAPPPERDPALFDEGLDDDPDQGPVNVALADLLAELGDQDSAKVTVNRITNDGGVSRKEYLFQCSPSEFNLDDVQDFYGPGQYNIVVFGPDPRRPGQRGILSNKRISVGKSRRQVQQHDAPPAVTPQQDAIAAALRDIHESNRRTLEAVAEKIGGRSEMLADMKMMAEIVSPTRGAAAAGPADLTQIVQLVPAIGELLKLAKTFAPKQSAPADDEGDNTMGVISKAIDTVNNLVLAARGGSAAPPAATMPTLSSPQLASGPAAPPPPRAPSADTTNDDDDDMKLALKLLLRAAAIDADVETYAAMVYEQAPDEVLQAMQTDGWFAMLCGIAPQCAQHQAWFTKLRDAVLIEMRGDVSDQGAGGAAASQQ